MRALIQAFRGWCCKPCQGGSQLYSDRQQFLPVNQTVAFLTTRTISTSLTCSPRGVDSSSCSVIQLHFLPESCIRLPVMLQLSQFAAHACRKLMGHKLTLEDLRVVHAVIFPSLKKLLDEHNADQLGLVFQVCHSMAFRLHTSCCRVLKSPTHCLPPAECGMTSQFGIWHVFFLGNALREEKKDNQNSNHIY